MFWNETLLEIHFWCFQFNFKPYKCNKSDIRLTEAFSTLHSFKAEAQIDKKGWDIETTLGTFRCFSALLRTSDMYDATYISTFERTYPFVSATLKELPTQIGFYLGQISIRYR